jgi:hypothetical protein
VRADLWCATASVAAPGLFQHGGSLSTMRETRARRDLIAGELAAGRNPPEAREVADLAGHSRASESLDTYSHVMPLDELAAERCGR